MVIGELHTLAVCASNDNYKTIMIAKYATLIFDIQSNSVEEDKVGNQEYNFIAIHSNYISESQ